MALGPVAENALIHPKEKKIKGKRKGCGKAQSQRSGRVKKGQKIFVSRASQAGNRGDSGNWYLRKGITTFDNIECPSLSFSKHGVLLALIPPQQLHPAPETGKGRVSMADPSQIWTYTTSSLGDNSRSTLWL